MMLIMVMMTTTEEMTANDLSLCFNYVCILNVVWGI